MEQAEQMDAPEGAARSQHVVYTLPHSAETLATVLTAALERIDTTDAATQVVIVTPDAETAVTTSDVVYRLTGAQGIDAVPVTSANRAARLIEMRPVHVVVGPPLELQTLVQRSTLKLDGVKTVILARADRILASGPDAVSSLEALFAEFPKEAGRLIVTQQLTADVEQLIERYARNARRIDGNAETQRDAGVDASQLTIQYVTVSDTARVPALRRLLDDLDPPSAAVVVRSAQSEGEVTGLLQQLGYRQADAPVRMTTEAVAQDTHTAIFFDAPASRSAVVSAAGHGVVQLVALVTPQELETLRTFGATLAPFTLSTAGSGARQRDRMLRDELLGVLGAGIPLREIIALEPLLEQFDGIEIAAAAVRLLEQARANRPQAVQNSQAGSTRDERFQGGRQFSDRPKRDFEQRPRRDFNDRPKRDFGDRPPRNFGGDRPKRDFGDRPKRDFGDRPKRDFNDRSSRSRDDRPKRDFGERDSSDRSDRRDERSGHSRHDRDDRRRRKFGRDDYDQ